MSNKHLGSDKLIYDRIKVLSRCWIIFLFAWAWQSLMRWAWFCFVPSLMWHDVLWRQWSPGAMFVLPMLVPSIWTVSRHSLTHLVSYTKIHYHGLAGGEIIIGSLSLVTSPQQILHTDTANSIIVNWPFHPKYQAAGSLETQFKLKSHDFIPLSSLSFIKDSFTRRNWTEPVSSSFICLIAWLYQTDRLMLAI